MDGGQKQDASRLRVSAAFDAANCEVATIILGRLGPLSRPAATLGATISQKGDKLMAIQFEEGHYLAKVTGQYFSKSSQKGTDAFTLQTRILKSLDNPKAECKPAFREITLWLTDKTYERVFNDLENLGYSGGNLEDLDPAAEDFHDFRGMEIQLECTHEEDASGKPQERWNLRRTRPPLQDRSGLRRFSRLWRQKHGQINGDAEVMDQEITDADVPF
jgi:hypothetical protein